MHKKLTIAVDEAIYEGLHRQIGRRKISQFIEELVRPYVSGQSLEAAYREKWLKTKMPKPKPWNGARHSSETSPMNRSEVWWMDFEPAAGGEITKTRPAVKQEA